MKASLVSTRTQLILIGFLSLVLSSQGIAQTCTAIANGNWTATSTWSCNRAPANGDRIIIPTGKTVTVDATTTTLSIDMDIYGTLNFASGSLFNNKNMTIEMGRTINVFPTGVITGGNGYSSLYMVTGYILFLPITSQIYSGSGSPITGPKSCTLGTCLLNGSLPIDLLSFTAAYQTVSQTIRLNWITISETNNETFTVERSSDGIHFLPVIVLPGAGNSHQQQHYQFVDADASLGLNYYRLRQTDYDGTSTYSKIVAVQQKAVYALTMDVSPNPSDGTRVRIDIGGNSQSEVSLLIFDHLGHQVYSKNCPSKERTLTVDFDHLLSDGIYWINIRQDNTQLTRKFLVHNH